MTSLAARLGENELRDYARRSSYIKKNPTLATAVATAARKDLERIYAECRDYACSSIMDGLMSFDGLKKGQIYNIDCSKDSFFLLARVRTNWEKKTIEETAEARKYFGFTVLTEKNLSHFPGRVLYGYRNGIDKSMIAHIYPCDSDTDGYETDPLKLTKLPELLLDIDDLCASALKMKTYCQVTIATKTLEGAALMPDIVVAIDKITADDKRAARERELPILLIRRAPNTVMEVYDAHGRVELANPTLI